MHLTGEKGSNAVGPPVETGAKAGSKQETEFIETNNGGLAEKGGKKVVGSSDDEDIPLTEEDFQFFRDFEASGRSAKTLKKLDWRIIPILVIIYLAAFLDR
jgi:hypothetical protein